MLFVFLFSAALVVGQADHPPRLRSIGTLCRNFCAKGLPSDFQDCLTRCLDAVNKPLPTAFQEQLQQVGSAAEQDLPPLKEQELQSPLMAIDGRCRSLCRKQHASRAMLRTCITACDVEAEEQLQGAKFPNAPTREQIEKVLAFEAAEEQRRPRQ